MPTLGKETSSPLRHSMTIDQSRVFRHKHEYRPEISTVPGDGEWREAQGRLSKDGGTSLLERVGILCWLKKKNFRSW